MLENQTPTTRPKVILVDGSSYLYRAFHAFPPLSNYEGYPTGAMHGMVSMLTKLNETYQPDYFAVIFDAPGKNFRHQLYPDYKATRQPIPNVLEMQIVPIQQLIKALGFPLLVVPNVEADDVIGTVSKIALDAGAEVIIATSDKDMTQLLTDKAVTLLDTMKNEVIGRDEVAHRFKVDALRPEQVVDFLTLAGDASDNVPGVWKVGAKTAAKWLKQYGTLDNIIAHQQEIKGKVGEYFRAGIADLPLWQKLVTIDCQLNLNLSLADLRRSPIKVAELSALCQQYELNAIRQHYLPQQAPAAAPTPSPAPQAEIKPQYHCITNPAALAELLFRLENAPFFAFDTETNSLDYMQADLVGISLALRAGEAFYLPFAHQLSVNLDKEKTLAALKPILENPAIRKIGQHLKFDCHILARENITLRGISDDTMLMSYLFHSTATRHNLDDLAAFYLKHQTTHFTDIAGKGKKQLTFDQIPLEQATNYACEDADVTLRLQQFFTGKFSPAMEKLYREVELPLAKVLFKMEEKGVCVDVAALEKQSAEISAKLTDIEKQAYQLAGEEFNLNSPKQLREILFEKLELNPIRKSPTGQASTNEEVLEKLAEEHQLPALLLTHRELAKLKSTYTDRLPEQINATTGRIHTSYHQALTSTGRLSSSDPNLQNIPIRSAEGRRIRQAFIAPAGSQILAADYSQIELRIMAHLSEDTGLLAAFAAGKDIHQATAAEIFSLPVEKVTREQRRSAKTINFGLIYGMSAYGLARQLSISHTEASAYIEKYFERYPKVKAFMENIRESARRQGFVETICGRRLYVPDINSNHPQKRQAAERLAINAPMQGSAADIIKIAMLSVARFLEKEPRGKMLMQVHDELVFEVQSEAIEEIRPQIMTLMEKAFPLKVPLVVEAGIGRSWDEAH